MSEREGGNWPGEGKPVAAEVSERIRSILSDAESAADALRHQAEQDAAARRRAAETEALMVIEEARREAERFLADRIQRVSQLSDEILERGQSVVERLDAAEQVRADLAGLVTALGETAARLANEVRAMPGPRTPDIAPAPPRTSEPAAEQQREPVAEPTPLRPAPAAPNPVEPAPVDAAAEEAGEPEAAEPEPTPEEIELLERVRAAERERSAAGDEPDNAGPAAPEANGSSETVSAQSEEPELVEVAAPVAGRPEADADGGAQPGGDPGAGADQALGARLVALQMAVAGGNRGEVGAHLRRAFDLNEPDSILDDIFGSGTAADKRVVWPEVG